MHGIEKRHSQCEPPNRDGHTAMQYPEHFDEWYEKWKNCKATSTQCAIALYINRHTFFILCKEKEGEKRNLVV